MSARTLAIETAEVFEPLLHPARDKGARGGRGSGKSHFFADLMVEDALRFPGDAGEGLRGICGREIQKSLKDSAKFLIESKLDKHRLGEADGFKVFKEAIETPGDGLLVFQGLQDHTSESIKSFEGFHRFWGEESHTLTKRSINLIRPTIRWENRSLGLQSEMWWSWNPRHKKDAVDSMLRGDAIPTGAVVVEANWSDNPWFPQVLEQERLDCLKNNPDQYDHIWEGGYATVNEGAYFAQHITTAKKDGRIGGHVAADPLMTTYAIWDIGGTGAKADACSIWIVQNIGKEIRFLDYYEAVGQPLATHVQWLRDNGYEKAHCVLPHDGSTNEKVYDVSYESALRGAGFVVTVIPNQGQGAAMARVERARQLFPRMWFDSKCQPGIDAIGWYHEKKDEKRDIGLGPNHDWSSHGADAFGLAAIFYKEPQYFDDDDEYDEGDYTRNEATGY